MNKREFDALQRRVTTAERLHSTDRGIARRIDTQLLEARIFITAIRAILINKNVCTAAEFNAAVAFARANIAP